MNAAVRMLSGLVRFFSLPLLLILNSRKTLASNASQASLHHGYSDTLITLLALFFIGAPISALAADNSTFFAQSVTATMVTGATQSVTVRFKNPVGATAWSTTTYKLGSQNPQDTARWGITRVPLATNIAAGGTATFTFNITAPTTPGTYAFQWKMINGTTWFGALSTSVNIVVAAPKITGVLDATVSEGQKCTNTISLSGPTPVSGSVYKLELITPTTLAAGAAAATAGVDYQTAMEYSIDNGVSFTGGITNGSNITIPVGKSSFRVRSTTLTDGLVESNEQYWLMVTPVSGTTGLRDYGICTITNVASAPTVSISSITPITVNEGSKGVATVNFSGPLTTAGQLSLTVANSTTIPTAAVGVDYTSNMEYSLDGGASYTTIAAGVVFSVPVGKSSILARVSTYTDSVTEGNEGFRIFANANTTSSGLTGFQEGLVTILDVPTIAAANCSAAAIQTAVDSALNGYTVMIPPGTCIWAAGDRLNVLKGIYLRGAGRDSTIISHANQATVINPAPGTDGRYTGVIFDCSNGNKVTMSDIGFKGNNVPGIQDTGVLLKNGCVDFRIFNNRFENFSFAALGIDNGNYPQQRGVVFLNEFKNNYVPDSPTGITFGVGYGVQVFGNGTYPTTLELGTQNAVFVEENNMNGNRHHIASGNGSKYVFRNNYVTATDATRNFAMIDAHGLTASVPVGSRSYEIYRNQIYTDVTAGNSARTLVGIRGGDGVIFENTIYPNGALGIQITRTIELEVEGGACTAGFPVPYQLTQGWFWNNTATPFPNGYGADSLGIANTCPALIRSGTTVGQGVEYQTTSKPGYQPFTYPHPLR